MTETIEIIDTSSTKNQDAGHSTTPEFVHTEPVGDSSRAGAQLSAPLVHTDSSKPNVPAVPEESKEGTGTAKGKGRKPRATPKREVKVEVPVVAEIGGKETLGEREEKTKAISKPAVTLERWEQYRAKSSATVSQIRGSLDQLAR